MNRIILKKSVVTEKAIGKKQRYVFMVTRDATKHEIADAIEKTYKVTVESVRTLVVKAKPRVGGKKRMKVKGHDTKKAYITLSKGEIAVES